MNEPISEFESFQFIIIKKINLTTFDYLLRGGVQLVYLCSKEFGWQFRHPAPVAGELGEGGELLCRIIPQRVRDDGGGED